MAEALSVTRHRPGTDRGPARLDILAASLIAVVVVAVVGSSFTATDPGSWYDRLDKPAFTPPGWVFGAAWTVLYAAMAVAAWLVARHGVERPMVRTALVAYGVQLVLNLSWTLVFFGLEAPLGGLLVIAALLMAIAATIQRFRPVDGLAAALLVPYLAWVVFATALNATILGSS